MEPISGDAWHDSAGATDVDPEQVAVAGEARWPMAVAVARAMALTSCARTRPPGPRWLLPGSRALLSSR